MSNHVFISYARADGSDFARKLHDDLEAMGLNMWLDAEDIPKGASWTLTIQRAIMTCRAFIFVITPASYDSKVCNLELQQAWENNPKIPILPIYLKEVETVPFLIKDINYTDCQTDVDSGLKAIFDEISKIPAGEDTPESEILVPESVARPGANQAKIYSDADDVDFMAQAGLFGRDALVKQIGASLTGDNSRVLLQAFGGVGKTALAAEMSYKWIEEKSENVLWLRMGASDSEGAFEALSHPFGASKAMATTPADDKAKVLRDLIKGANIGLVVLDDCWNGQSLMALQKAIPRKVPLLVTARQRYPLTPIFSIPDLPENEALALLRKLAPTLVQDEESAIALCQKLGFHAFGIEVAGRTMQAKNYTAKALLTDIEKTDITQLQVPLEYQQAGRESIAALIETTLNELPDEAKAVFLTWGAFWSPQITPELMMQYFVGKLEVSEEMIADARERVPDVASMSDDEIRPLLEQVLAKQPIDAKPATDALSLLQEYGLATRNNAQQTEDGRPLMVASYRLHDLAFEYAKAQNSNDTRNRAVDACLTHIARHKEASLENFATLEPEIDNFMGASNFATSEKRYEDVEQFSVDLYQGYNLQGGVLQFRGYYLVSITLLQRAAKVAKEMGRKESQGHHLGNLGTAHRNLGDYPNAITYYNQALAIAEEIGNIRSKGIRLGNLGNVYLASENYAKAIEYYQQSLMIAHEIDDIRNKGNWLGNLGNAYDSLGDTARAIEYYQQSLAIRREIGDKRGEGGDLGNLGSAYHSLGEYARAIEYYSNP